MSKCDTRTNKERALLETDPFTWLNHEQGILDSKREIGLKIVNLPMLAATAAASAGGLAAKPNVRYYIKGLMISLRNIVTDTCTGATVSCNINNIATVIAAVSMVPSAVGVVNQWIEVNVLTDENSSAIITQLTAAPTYLSCTFYYCEVPR